MSSEFEVLCRYCGAPATLTSSKEVYYNDYGMIYLCRPCKAWVGCHKGTSTPLGFPANAELREARKATHAIIDPIWRAGKMTRHETYAWLGGLLSLKKDDCHVAMFDIELCNRAAEVIRQSPFYQNPNEKE